jgi:hypothetical protein
MNAVIEQTPPPVIYVKISELNFDPQNPRFYRFREGLANEKVIEEMIDDESVQDLMRSIGEKGYFVGEPLLISKDDAGSYIVVEGNRRLAAAKLLNGEIPPPAKRQNSIAEIRKDVKVVPPESLPCIFYEDRGLILRYLGYRHITGVKEWDALSKARYLAELKETFYSNVVPKDAQFKALAKDIGSRPDYVAQLLTALKIYDRSEENDFFDLNLQAKQIDFSYITTALSYSTFPTWLGLIDKGDVDAEQLVGENVKKLFAWMFVQDQQGRTIVGESRNIKELAAIVGSKEAREILEKTSNRSEAFLFTDGPQKAISGALRACETKLKLAWDLLGRHDAVSDEHLESSEEVEKLARNIRQAIKSKLEVLSDAR